MALTDLYTLPIRLGGEYGVHVISGSLTLATDEVIYTPASGKCAFLVGAFFSENNATTITFKSGSETIVAVELTTYQGMQDKIGNGVILASEAGQALKANPSVSITSAVFFVVEAASLGFM